jgi:hypothetical protein
MASDKEYNADLAAVCSEEKKFILRALQYCQDDASSRKGWWYVIVVESLYSLLDFFFIFVEFICGKHRHPNTGISISMGNLEDHTAQNR